MSKLILILCMSLFLAANSSYGENSSSNDSVELPLQEDNIIVETKNIYIPSQELTLKETIEQFFEQQYKAYASLQYIDLSYLVDINQIQNRNALIWLEALIQRRRLIVEHQFCYVETTQYPYTINYEKEARAKIPNKDEVTVHFTITGEKERVYPPFLAINARHSMRLKQVDGIWKITYHNYPGSSKFKQNIPLSFLTEVEMLKDLKEEFRTFPSGGLSSMTVLPTTASPYNPERAVQYAVTYINSPNPHFYEVKDWMGNCSNFTSQCLWYGFGTDNRRNINQQENMTSLWYAGQGGGSPAWENVEYFWNYATAFRDPKKQGLHGEVVDFISQLKAGGILQIRSEHARNTDELFNHNLLLIDKSTLLFAQNSPDCFVYYSDLVNVDTRMFNPQYLIAKEN